MVTKFSFGQNWCCLLVPGRWRCRFSIIIGVPVANSSVCVNKVCVYHIDTIINASSASFSNLMIVSDIMLNSGKA